MTTPALPAGSFVPGVTNHPVFTMEEVAWIAWQYWGQTGFQSNINAAIATAVAWAESKGNTQAHNAVPPDNSYGLWQINMLGNLGTSRRAQYNLASNNDLFSPATNARVAFDISAKGKNWKAWSTFQSGAYLAYYAQAKKAVVNKKQPPNITGGPEQTEHEGIEALFDPLLKFFKDAGMRTAGFVGGTALIIGAIVLIAKRGVK